ncbi:MAG: hypothetical protein HYX95_00950 [Chloroflexi bacterium]|nr:hypothetical protein [Chloroflexota bacterium]
MPGVLGFEVDLKADSATVLFDGGRVTVAEIMQVLAKNGYRVRQVVKVK